MAGIRSLGLGGDGDEVVAIEAAFDALGVAVPVNDASGWVTVGDVWRSAQRVAPAQTSEAASWDRFREAISSQSVVDFCAVDGGTLLLCEAYSLKDLARDAWHKIRG